MKKLFTLLLVCIIGLDVISAQTEIKGNVKDNAGERLTGVSISEKGTSNGTISGADGSFQLRLSGTNATLIFAYTGYETITVAVAGQSSFDVVLEESSSTLDQIVIVGSRRGSRVKS